MRIIDQMLIQEIKPGPSTGTDVGIAARRVRVLFDRLRLHLETERFLAGRRRDPLWETGCDYAVLVLARLASRLRASVLEAPIPGIADQPAKAAVSIRSCRSGEKRRLRERLHSPLATRRGR